MIDDGAATLTQLRARIDALDVEFVDWLGKRFAITRRIGQFKADYALPVKDEQREGVHIERLRQAADAAGVSSELVAELFRHIMAEVVREHEVLQGQSS